MADIHHRGERELDAISRSFRSGNLSRLADALHIPRARQTKRNREDGLVAVDNIHTENDGDAQSTFFYSNALQFRNAFSPFEVKHSPHFAFANRGYDIALQGTSARYDIARYGEIELPEFLLERHFLKQVRHKTVHLFVSFSTFLLRRRAGGKKQRSCGHASKKNMLDGLAKIGNHGCF